jgi:hypothetical protein
VSGYFDERWLGKAIPQHHWHFHKRLLERYGIVLGPGEFSQMMKDIESGRAIEVRRTGKDRVVYSILNTRIYERYFVLVSGGHVVTALPRNKPLMKRWRRVSAHLEPNSSA